MVNPRVPGPPGQSGYGPPSNQGSCGPYDGPNDPPRQNPFGAGIGYDPAKPVEKPKVITNSRVELPAAAYGLESGAALSDLPLRPGTGTVGKDILVRVNQFKVKGWTNNNVQQYDILIGGGAEKKGKIMVTWKSKAVQNKLRSLTPNAPWIWDGNRIAWCSVKVPEQRILVDLDAEKGRTPRPGNEDKVYCQIKPTKPIAMAAIGAYLNRQMSFDNSCLEVINFLDHALRQWPSECYTASKRSFFARGTVRVPLDNVIEAMKGVYSSMRMCNPISSFDNGKGTGLAINVDVANGTFWTSQDVSQAARNLCKARNRNLDYIVFRNLLAPAAGPRGLTKSREFLELQKLQKLKFTVKHRGKETQTKVFEIKRFTFDNKNKEGAHSKNTKFLYKDRKTGKEEERSVYDHFLKQYNIQLVHWGLPLIESVKGGLFPMEIATLVPNQKFVYKLSPDQTSAMIKFAVTRPKQRLESVQHGVGMLKWHEDPYLKHFGISVDPQLTITKAKLLPNPEVSFAGSKLNPGTAGRWDLRGKKFINPSTDTLKCWGVCIVGAATSVQNVQNFFREFIKAYVGHGGKVMNKEPVIHEMERNDTDLSEGVRIVRQKTGSRDKMPPQIIFFVLPGRDSFMYERLKKNMECRFALFSQMLNVAHVNKAAPQYCSNVAMKVNAKLGGSTAKATVVGKPNLTYFSVPTMIIGADVSHASPGSPQSSMAAITMSMDREAMRYAATVQTNGHRVEMITPATWRVNMIPIFNQWIQRVGGGKGPQHIYYFRDGVSEGQFQHVLDQEVKDIRAAINEKYNGAGNNIKFTVVVCTKRHHIRFFPKDGDNVAGDRNGNANPGTLVERDVTHPFEHDFYLSAHSAIQGTARPVHYQVIMDEAKISPDDLHRLIYNHSYQYMRSTTPVSLFPAVYYAHLASNRARAHEAAPASDGPRGGEKFQEAQQDAANAGRTSNTDSSGAKPTEAVPLLPLGNPNQADATPLDLVVKIRCGMWYI